jgi:hypothetical protein
MSKKEFEVGVWYIIYGSLLAEANSEKEAEQIAETTLIEKGESAISNIIDKELGSSGVVL